MNTIIKLARRNIWRNKRRTIITATAIMFAVFFSIAMDSINRGIFDHMEQGMVKSFMGFAQIHSNGFWEDQTLDNAFIYDDEMKQLPSQYKEIQNFVPRLESFALASFKEGTKGVLVAGIDPEKENALTNLKGKITQGKYFSKNDSTVIIAEGLADYLSVAIGDTITLISSGYHGAPAGDNYIIKGFVKFGSPELNKQMVYLPLATAQDFYAAENLNLVTTLVVDTDRPNKIHQTVAKLSLDLDETYEVMSYEQLIPDLIQARQMKEAGQTFMRFILYAIISFGIFGTILMMIKERQYEFGVLTAIGLRRSKLSLIVWLETVFIGFFGVLAGILISLPLVIGLSTNPVELTGDAAAAYVEMGVEPYIIASTAPEIFYNQAITVFFIVTLLAFYPLFKISKLKPVEAMRS